MFESAVLRRPIFGDKLLDAGLLAEVLLFYQNVYLVLDHGSLISIASAIGANNLFRLVNDGHVKASFIMENMGTITTSPRGIPFHNFTSYQLLGEKKKRLSKDEALRKALERALGSSWRTQKFAKQLSKRIPVERLNYGPGKPMDIIGMAHEDLRDPTYTNAVIKLMLRELVPGLEIPNDWSFLTKETNDGFAALTNFDFDIINAEYHRYVSPAHSSISPAYLLAHILDARTDISLAAKHMAELVTTPMASKALSIKFSMMFEKRLKNAEEIELFQHNYLDAKSIREAINSGERNFSEFIDVLEQAQKFKAWLKDTHPEIGLAKEYYRSAIAQTWVEKLPGKLLRFAFFTGAGAIVDSLIPTGIGTVVGVGVSAADAFVIDKLLGGWRPNQFVEEKLSEFTNLK